MIVQSVLIALAFVALSISTAVGGQKMYDEIRDSVQQPETPDSPYGFDPSRTRDEAFTTGPQFHSTVEWFPSLSKSSYYKRGHFSNIPASFLELDYVDFSMIVVLPDLGKVPNEWHRKLENIDFPLLLSKIELQPTRIYLPKLKLNYLYTSDVEYTDSYHGTKYWNSGTLYNHTNKSHHFDGSTDTFLEINELGGHTLGTFHKGPLNRKYHGGKEEEFRVDRPFIVMVLQNNEMVLQALIERPIEYYYVLQTKNLTLTKTITVDSLTVSDTTENNINGTPDSSSQLVEEVNSIFSEELATIETTHPEKEVTTVETITPTSQSLSPTPTGSPLKYVYTYDGKGGQYNESGLINNKSLVVGTISKGILNANGTDAGFANHMNIVKNVLDHAVKTSESKSESVKGTRLMEWIYRKFYKKNETEEAKTKSTSEGTESILTIFN